MRGGMCRLRHEGEPCWASVFACPRWLRLAWTRAPRCETCSHIHFSFFAWEHTGIGLSRNQEPFRLTNWIGRSLLPSKPESRLFCVLARLKPLAILSSLYPLTICHAPCRNIPASSHLRTLRF